MTTQPKMLARFFVIPVVAFGLACAGVGYDDDMDEEAAPVSAVKPAKWNQDRVAKIGAELALAVKELRNAVRDDPVSNIGSGQASARHRLLDDLRVLENETGFLARQLAQGASREATRPTYARIGLLSRNVTEESRKLFLHEALLSRITTAGGLWQRLSPYYAGSAG